jgi:hypothetical protein
MTFLPWSYLPKQYGEGENDEEQADGRTFKRNDGTEEGTQDVLYRAFARFWEDGDESDKDDTRSNAKPAWRSDEKANPWLHGILPRFPGYIYTPITENSQ